MANLAGPLDLGRQGKSRLLELTRYAFERTVYFSERTLPDMAWRALDFEPAAATPFPRRFEAASFIEPAQSPDGEAFATALNQLGAYRNPRDLLQLLAKPATFVP